MKSVKSTLRTIDPASQITWWLPKSRSDALTSRRDSSNLVVIVQIHMVIVQNHVVKCKNHVVILQNHVVISKSRGKCPKSRRDFWTHKSRGDFDSEVIFIKEIY